MATTPNSNTNVDVGRPKVGGYAFRAPIGTTLPTDATTALAAAFVNLGYVSNAGLRVTYDRTTTDHREWNGEIVETTQDEYGETYTVEFIESLRGDLLKALFGDENVEISAPTTLAEGSVHIKHNALEPENAAWSFDMKSRKSSKRITMGVARVTAIGEVAFVANDLIRYSATIKAYPDANGDTSNEYKTLPKLPAV